jgi:hypothetical protein
MSDAHKSGCFTLVLLLLGFLIGVVGVSVGAVVLGGCR